MSDVELGNEDEEKTLSHTAKRTIGPDDLVASLATQQNRFRGPRLTNLGELDDDGAEKVISTTTRKTISPTDPVVNYAAPKVVNAPASDQSSGDWGDADTEVAAIDENSSVPVELTKADMDEQTIAVMKSSDIAHESLMQSWGRLKRSHQYYDNPPSSTVELFYAVLSGRFDVDMTALYKSEPPATNDAADSSMVSLDLIEMSG